MAIVVPIVADTSGFTRGLTKGSTGIAKFGKIAALAAGAAGVGALVATVKVGIGEFMQQEKVIAQTNAVLKSTKGVANVTAKEIGKLSESLMKKSGIDDEAIQSGQNLLLTFTKVRNEAGKGNDVFNQATVLMTDLSVAMGKDLNSSAMLVGKALNDPIKGVSALSRAGVQFTKEQKETIKTMVESGNVMGAQKMILKELETQFGGSAEAAGKTLGGQLNILKETFNNMAGDLVARFMPGVARAAQALVDFIGKFADAPTLKAKVQVITGAIGDVWQKVKDWWNTGERKELPSGIKLTPPGKTQVTQAINDMFNDFGEGAKEKANSAGRQLGEWVLGAFKNKGKKDGPSVGNEFVLNLFVNVNAFKAAKVLVERFIDGLEEAFEGSDVSFADIIGKWLSIPDDSPLRSAYNWGKRIVDSVGDGADSPRPRKQVAGKFANLITQAVKDAVQSARQSLAGSGSTIAGMLAQITESNTLSPGGRNSAAMLKEQRKLENRRLEIEEKRLKAALEEAEDKTEAQLALDEFYFQKDATLRQRSIDDTNRDNQKKISDLVESFNQGNISAQKFYDDLQGIVGPDQGLALGEGFAGAFKREIESAFTIARDIWDTIGKSNLITGASGNVASTLQSENKRRFDEALAAWQKRFDARKKQAEDYRKRADSDGGSKITDAERKEITAIMADWVKKPGNARPVKADYGLALGGILNKQVFTAGEAGPEAVMPLTGRGGVMLRDALGLNGGQGSTYNITVNAGMGTSGIDLGREIVAAIKQYERTNGNVFAGA